MPSQPRGFRPFPFPYHTELEVRIESLSNQGLGVARVPLPESPAGGTDHGRGWVVMIAFALPGEIVRARVFRNHANFSEADLIEVMEPSVDRVSPRCPLFGRCGGCQYQNLAYPAQLDWKRRQVEELLEHMAGIIFPVNPVIPSPAEFGYRAKITPHFDKPRRGGIRAIGFLRAGTRHDVIDVTHCSIATDAINEQLATVREEVMRDAARFKTGATLLLRETQDGRVSTDPNAIVTSRVGDLEFEHLAGDFFQNNPFILPAFVGFVIDDASRSGARFLVDAYCGSGLFAISAARRFEGVAGVEVNPRAADRASRNAARNGVGNARFLAAPAEAFFGSFLFPAGETAVIIDPPRAGCSDAFLQQLVTWHPRCCVYVSCNPATQMRDLRTFFAAGYRLRSVQPFDLFPQTKHVECVISLGAPDPPA